MGAMCAFGIVLRALSLFCYFMLVCLSVWLFLSLSKPLSIETHRVKSLSIYEHVHNRFTYNILLDESGNARKLNEVRMNEQTSERTSEWIWWPRCVSYCCSVVVGSPSDRHTRFRAVLKFSSSVFSRHQTFSRIHCAFYNCAYVLDACSKLNTRCSLLQPTINCVKFRSHFRSSSVAINGSSWVFCLCLFLIKSSENKKESEQINDHFSQKFDVVIRELL